MCATRSFRAQILQNMRARYGTIKPTDTWSALTDPNPQNTAELVNCCPRLVKRDHNSNTIAK